jgi:hypothetical protein
MNKIKRSAITYAGKFMDGVHGGVILRQKFGLAFAENMGS